jgi:hypothetical protein
MMLCACNDPHGSTGIVDGRQVPAANRYCEEFAAAISISTHWNTGEPLYRPYYYLHRTSDASPDGTCSLSPSNDLRDYYHTITLVRTGAPPETILVIQEPDPGSGTSHGFQWSRDSKAVFIYGSGTAAGNIALCDAALIYIVDQRMLYSVDLRPLLTERLKHDKK